MSVNVVTFKWQQPNYRSRYSAAQVNVLARMVRRHYPHPHRFICVTDDATGLDASIEHVPLWKDFADVPNPHGRQNPSCYRRLKAFGRDVAPLFGDRFVWLDLDTVITDDVTSIFHRKEDFVIWGELTKGSYYNGSMVLMTAGCRQRVLDDFDPRMSPVKAYRSGRRGSDQGWISFCLGPGEAKWTTADGVYSYRIHIQPKGNHLPAGARIVMFHGRQDPWAPPVSLIPWVKDHYR